MQNPIFHHFRSRSRRHGSYLRAVILGLAAWLGRAEAAEPPLIITHVHVLTMNRKQPEAECVVIQADRIAEVGRSQADCSREGATILDGKGATLVPGFNDAHVHIGLAMTLSLVPAIPSLPRARWLDRVRAEASQQPYGRWLVARSTELPAGVDESRALDFIDHPVAVVTPRGALLNTRGVGELKLGRTFHGGFIPGRHVAAVLAAISHRLPYQDKRQTISAFLAEASQLGLTSVQFISDEMPHMLEELRQAGQLTLRVRFVPLGYRVGGQFYESSWPQTKPLWVRVDGVKYYHDDGAQLSQKDLMEILKRASTRGQRVVFHVLGRYSLRKLLGAMERQVTQDQPSSALWRLEHVDEADAEDAARIARLGLSVCANPPLIAEWKSPRYGPLATLLRAGVRLCLGSDWVGPSMPRSLSPLVNLEVAVTHAGQGGPERISAAQALEAYTLGSAQAEGLASEKGSIEPGKLADLVLLSDDPIRAKSHEISHIRVLLTMVGGHVVYQSDGWGHIAPLR